MSVMAGGAVSPRQAFEYVAQFSGVKSIVFGASSQSNIQSTRNILREIEWA